MTDPIRLTDEEVEALLADAPDTDETDAPDSNDLEDE